MHTGFQDLADFISKHQLMSHPLFERWEYSVPKGDVLAAIWFQIMGFCAATRPGHNFVKALRDLNLKNAADHIEEIVKSEKGHGEDLATMVAYLMNAGDEVWHPDLVDQAAIERALKQCSDKVFAGFPGYDPATGLLRETRNARAVFDARKGCGATLSAYALGTTLALEWTSDDYLIPGEIDMVRAYGVPSLDNAPKEMLYLKEHGGEGGAEHEHQERAEQAITAFITSPYMNAETWSAMQRGAQVFLDRLIALWDVLDAQLPPQTTREAS